MVLEIPFDALLIGFTAILSSIAEVQRKAGQIWEPVCIFLTKGQAYCDCFKMKIHSKKVVGKVYPSDLVLDK